MRTMDDCVKQLFGTLSKWRDLPTYQLERRVDCFFSCYVGQIIQHCLSVPEIDLVIPEFPLRPLKHNGKRLAEHLDYLCLSKASSTAYLVELKTDMSSVLDEDQLKSMMRAGSKDKFRGMIEFLAKVAGNPNCDKWKKYKTLCSMLLGYISYSPPAESKRAAEVEAMQGIECIDGLIDKVMAVYILPKKPLLKHRNADFAFIDFNMISEVTAIADPLFTVLRENLSEWAKDGKWTPKAETTFIELLQTP